jgi:hypothetical protein
MTTPSQQNVAARIREITTALNEHLAVAALLNLDVKFTIETDRIMGQRFGTQRVRVEVKHEVESQ